MSWTITVWGQPPSVNHLYETVWRTDRRGRTYKGRKKNDEALAYQRDAQLVMQAARPSGWVPQGQVRITYDLYLHRDMDCDNLLKTIHDGFQQATGINDSRVLPCVRSKTIGVPLKEARAELTIEGLSSPSLAPGP